MSKYIYVKIFLLVIFFYTNALAANIKSPLPEIVTIEWKDLKILGETSLKKLGFHVYDASFWSNNRKSHSESLLSNKSNMTDYVRSNICVLSITYARNIKAEKLITRTKKEWLRLGYKNTYPINDWIIMLRNIWPDVKKNDQLIVVSTPQGQSVFYDENKRLGTIDDINFGPAFLAIWVDKNSRYKKNRLELIGVNIKEVNSEEK